MTINSIEVHSVSFDNLVEQNKNSMPFSLLCAKETKESRPQHLKEAYQFGIFFVVFFFISKLSCGHHTFSWYAHCTHAHWIIGFSILFYSWLIVVCMLLWALCVCDHESNLDWIIRSNVAYRSKWELFRYFFHLTQCWLLNFCVFAGAHQLKIESFFPDKMKIFWKFSSPSSMLWLEHVI